MPLIESHTDEARDANIAQLIKDGKKLSQALAIAYSIQQEHKKKQSAK